MKSQGRENRKSMQQKIVTRFAPSPTGFLHIGGARTALFNWLFARGRGGNFLLRIEDTDRARHNEAAVAAILDGLSWLGLDWDAPPVSQYENRQRHVEIADKLLAEGKAYRCYLTPEETEALRNQARQESRRFVSPWREATQSPPERAFAVRFRAPVEGETIVDDAVQGAVKFPNTALDDLVILRSETRAPTYNLAVVVDDHEMGVTHVIRGDDHLANAARQQQIYEALGWPVPVFAHVPLIHGQDGAKLSKRHGALGVEAYRDEGFLPEGLANYLMKLGWAHGDEEIIPRERALEIFDLKGINKAPARLDLEKLKFINAAHLARLGEDAFLERSLAWLEAAGVAATGDVGERLKRAAPYVKARVATLKEVPAAAAFATVERPLQVSGKAAKPLQKEGALDRLAALAARLEEVAAWDNPAGLDAALQEFAGETGLSFGQIGPPARAALTGGAPAPSLGEVLYVLGKTESLARIRDQLS